MLIRILRWLTSHDYLTHL